ncbi:MAG: RNA polymerase sigma factor [Candidatus Omnitrophica bacterium]|nr:RNA polymerase sigma factor [Candidatus Omnitrophota bacterium]
MEERNQDPQQTPDEELLLAAQAGDMTAFEMLHRRYRTQILNYLYRFTGSYHTAEELTQEVFIKVYTHLATYRNMGKAKSWMYTIATNLAKNALRSLKSSPQISLDTSVNEEDTRKLGEMVGDGRNLGGDLERRELQKQLHEAIHTLPVKYREVLLLCGQQRLSYKEAGRILHCSEQTVGVRLNRARKMLKNYINPNDYVQSGGCK